ncbi:CLUMA_CG008225, isoform A [Clunio marinus]|uniref:CLUMA_CG008225, isoform A n=1 Tax=Clunio marinus TaxID=568069 RepID=A0A1J1I352_9DIPT|nr:CLUMA_CG008225, isoform A [Clunio marinus]
MMVVEFFSKWNERSYVEKQIKESLKSNATLHITHLTFISVSLEKKNLKLSLAYALHQKHQDNSSECVAVVALMCTLFLFLHTKNLTTRLSEMENRLTPSAIHSSNEYSVVAQDKSYSLNNVCLAAFTVARLITVKDEILSKAF